MSDIPSPSENPAHEIGELCVGGAWTCAHGDLETLGHIAERLAGDTPEPLHGRLVVLADLSRRDPNHAVAAWMRLKEQVRRRDRRPPP